MSHIPHILPDLVQTSDELQIGDDSLGTVLKSTSNGVMHVLLQDLVTYGKLKLAQGVDANDAVAMAQHTALDGRVAALETLLASDDLNLDEAQEWVDFMKNNATDITALTTSLNTQIAAVQADVDQNEVDSDAADAALDTRVVSLEAFETLIDSAVSVVNDNGKEDLIVEHDVNVQENWYANGTKVLNAARQLSNIVSVDSGTDTVLSATGIAHTDALAAKHAVRYKKVLHSDSSAAYFGSVVKQDCFITGITFKVNTGFDAGATLSVGDDGDITLFGDLNAANLSQVGTYHMPIYMKMSADKQPKYTVSGSPTAGDVEIFLEVSA